MKLPPKPDGKGWFENRGRRPRDENEVREIVWFNGNPASQNFAARQLRWTLTGWDYDVAWSRKV